MHRTVRNIIALCAVSLVFVAAQTCAQDVGANVITPDARVIVKFKADATLTRAAVVPGVARESSRALALAQRLGVAISAGNALSERSQVVFASGITSVELARRLALESDVEYAAPDERRYALIAPNDPLYHDGQGGNGPAAGQWYLRSPSGSVQSSINVEPAWNVTIGSPAIVVADLDTGVRFEHPDLQSVAAGGNLLPGYDMISDPNFGNDGDGRDPDASDPGDWVTQAEISQRGPFFQCTPLPRNSSWHGTQTAGIIAALTNNGIGMASVGRTIRLLPVRVLGKCGGFDSDIIAGVRWAAGMSVPGVPLNTNPARVINMSLGAEGVCPAAWQDAIAAVNAAGAVVVASAGNTAGHTVGAPANCPGVIAVAGLRHTGTKVGFSDLGPEIAISAPGGNCVNTAAGSQCLYPILTTSDAGTTVPSSSIYTDGIKASLGTSFSAPLVTGTVALMLSARPAMTPFQVRLALQSTARPFPTVSGDDDGITVPQCMVPQFDGGGNAIDQLECFCSIDTCGAGMLDAGAAVTGVASAIPAQVPVEGLWWNLPANSESGWGINLAQQGSVIFATWFTYDLTGKAWWLSMTGNKTSSNPDVYSGPLVQTRGPAFSAVPFDPALVTRTTVGSGTLTFSDFNRGKFAYVVNGAQQSKSITRQLFGALPTCVFSAQPSFDIATNYEDLWWVAGGAESGWGVNLTHQGDTIFATWFTYNVDGSPLWLSVTAPKTAEGTYSGPLIRTGGPAFNAVPFDPSLVTRTVVGTASFVFVSGNAGTFTYTVDGVLQSKAITRQLFAPPAGTVCH